MDPGQAHRLSLATADARARSIDSGTRSGWMWLRLIVAAAWLLLLLGAMTLGKPPAEQPAPGMVSTVWGVEVPAWLGATALGSTVATLIHIVAGPEPWRATRWAWFWLIGNPFGLVAFLLLAGPTPGVVAPGTDRRLHGGWAFVVGTVIAMLLVGAGLR